MVSGRGRERLLSWTKCTLNVWAACGDRRSVCGENVFGEFGACVCTADAVAEQGPEGDVLVQTWRGRARRPLEPVRWAGG